MPRSFSKLQQVAPQQAASQAAHWEERYQQLTHQFGVAQVQFQAVRTQYRAVQQECHWLQQVVCIKQQVIEELLPYYPHPLTAELLDAIELY
jgi:hypothetical protein